MCWKYLLGNRPPIACASRDIEANGQQQPGELDRREGGQDRGRKDPGDLRADEARDEQAERGRGEHVQRGAQRERRQAAFDGHLEQDHRQHHQADEVDERDGHIGQLLAQQKLEARRGRDVQVGNRAELLLAHHAQRRHHRGDQHQDHHDDPRHHSVGALECLVVAEPGLDRQRQRRGLLAGATRELLQEPLVHAFDIAAAGLGAERHRPIQPHRYLGRSPAPQIAAEAGRDFDRELDLAGAQPRIQVSRVDQLCLLLEVARAGKVLQVSPALGRVVSIQRGVGEVLDVEGDAVAEHDHQQDRPEQGEGKPDGIAADLGRLALCISPDAREADQHRARSSAARRGGPLAWQRGPLLRGGQSRQSIAGAVSRRVGRHRLL